MATMGRHYLYSLTFLWCPKQGCTSACTQHRRQVSRSAWSRTLAEASVRVEYPGAKILRVEECGEEVGAPAR